MGAKLRKVRVAAGILGISETKLRRMIKENPEISDRDSSGFQVVDIELSRMLLGDYSGRDYEKVSNICDFRNVVHVDTSFGSVDYYPGFGYSLHQVGKILGYASLSGTKSLRPFVSKVSSSVNDKKGVMVITFGVLERFEKVKEGRKPDSEILNTLIRDLREFENRKNLFDEIYASVEDSEVSEIDKEIDKEVTIEKVPTDYEWIKNVRKESFVRFLESECIRVESELSDLESRRMELKNELELFRKEISELNG